MCGRFWRLSVKLTSVTVDQTLDQPHSASEERRRAGRFDTLAHQPDELLGFPPGVVPESSRVEPVDSNRVRG
jgi:hypothetical protein